MIRVMGNMYIFKILQRTVVSKSNLKSGSFAALFSVQNNAVRNFSLGKYHCQDHHLKSSMVSNDEDDSDYINIYKNLNFKEITNDDPELIKKVKILLLQIESWHHDGRLVPKKMTTDEFKELFLNLKGTYSKLKYLKFLAKNEFKEESAKKRRERFKLKYLEKKQVINLPDHLDYSIGHNNLFMTIRDSSVLNLLKTKLGTSMMFSNNLVFDMSYEKYMTPREVKECIKQIDDAVILNRNHINPLNVHICNLPSEGLIRERFDRLCRFKKIMETVSVHEESYLEIFDPKNLVYLSPNSDTELQEFNPEDVYIIGAYVDKGSSLPISFGKAKAEKLRSAKLPLDLNFKWKQGGKALPLNIMCGIMLDLNFHKDMKKALSLNTPTRLYYKEHELHQLYLSKTSKQRKRLQLPPQITRQIRPCKKEGAMETFEEIQLEKKMSYHCNNLHQAEC